MKSYEAIQTAIGGKTVEHAKRLGLSTSLVNKWQEPSTDFTDSGAFNPLDRIETIMETALINGSSKKASFTPLQYLAERFNHICIPIPEQKGDLKEISDELLRLISEFGDVTKETAEAMVEDGINRNECRRIQKEVWELIRQALRFSYKVEACAK